MQFRGTDGLFRHSVLLMGATLAGSFCNMLFHVVMGRKLSVPEYGVLSSLAGIVLVASTPMDALRTAMSHFAARLAREGRPGAVRGLTWRWCGIMAWPALILAAVGIVFREPIAHFFQITTPVPVVLTSIVLGGSLFIPLLTGALIGVQSFVWMSVSAQSWGVVRLVAGAAFVLWLGATASWAIAGQGVGVLASVALGVWAIRHVVPRGADSRAPVHGVEQYFIQSLVILAAFAWLMNADIIMVKHYFPPYEAGLFAQAGTIARTVVFLPMPIALAMFPKVASHGTTDAVDRRTLNQALLYVVLIIGASVAACSAIPWLPLWILYGNRNPDAEMMNLVRAVLWAMAPLGVSYLLMNFELAQHRFRAAYSVVFCAAGYLAAVVLWHDTVWKVPMALAGMSVLSVVLLLLGLPRKSGVAAP